MKKRSFLMLCISLMLVISTTACTPEAPTPLPPPTPPVVTPVAVKLSSKTAALVIGGEIITLTAEVEYSDGVKNNKVKWSTSDAAIVKVVNGVLTAVSVGSAVVTAAATEKTSVADSCVIEVVEKPEIIINTEALTMIVGKGNVQLFASVKHRDGTIDSKAAWASSKSSVATISDNGLITPVAVGTSVITATALDGAAVLSATSTITVLADASSLANSSANGIVYTLLNPDTNVNLGYSVRAEKKDIVALIIPNTHKGLQVIEVETEGFRQCTEITSFSFGKNVKKIGANAFRLETETIPGSKPVYKNHKSIVSSCLRTNLMLNPGTVLAEEALADSFFKIITVPEGVTTIPQRAFAGSTVTIVNLPTTLTAIEGYAFAGCISLTSALLTHTKVTAIGLPGSDEYAIGSSFLQCGVLKDIGTLPVTLKTLEYSSFETCSSLSNIVLNEGLEKIGYAAFRSCASVEKITIPTTVKTISENAFGQWGDSQTITTNIKESAKPSGWHEDWMGAKCRASIIYKA